MLEEISRHIVHSDSKDNGNLKFIASETTSQNVELDHTRCIYINHDDGDIKNFANMTRSCIIRFCHNWKADGAPV